jgi:hypothetical protein
MKYWNKDKNTRQKHWFKVDVSNILDRFERNLKRELQLYNSPGKFYMYYAGRYVWFEREQDAMWFRLKWL